MLDVLLQVNRPPLSEFRLGLAALAINFISIGLLFALTIVFLTTWRKTKAPFMLGLVLFSGVLLLTDLLRVFRGFGLLGNPVAPEFLEMVALAVLLYLATR
jgi:uncharacterized membrane protein YgdD (TMEM256/DUF423 family)